MEPDPLPRRLPVELPLSACLEVPVDDLDPMPVPLPLPDPEPEPDIDPDADVRRNMP